MPIWLYIIFSVCVSSFIGGITNHFAIQMLFRPRTEWRVMGRRVPFTPGLIPKRKDEIAGSLGDVVSSYLVTADGMREMLQRESFQQSIEDKIVARLEAMSEGEDGLTVRQLALRYWSEEQWNERKEQLAAMLQGYVQRGIAYAWEDKGIRHKQLKELIPGWQDETLASLAMKAESIIVKSLSDELQSPQGQRMLRNMTVGMIDKAGGFMGALAGIFVDEDKLVARMTPMLVEQLHSESVRQAIRNMIGGVLDKAGGWTAEEAVQKLSDREDALGWLQEGAERYVRPERWIAALEQADIGGWLANNREQWRPAIHRAMGTVFELLTRNIHRVLEAVQLPKLVREQVEKFPVERLEQVVLSVSGREFRAITWLGVLLGGIIGLIQALLVQFVA